MAGLEKSKTQFQQRNQKNYSNPDLNTKVRLILTALFTSKGQSMLSYRHSFHAGNHADVLKHIVLMLILENLSLKEKGFYYLDTHSGVGRYRLSSNESEKTGEYKEGIGRLWERTDLPEEVARYVALIKNSIMAVKNYVIMPGHSMIAAQLLRSQDRALLTELHPSDFPLLRNNFKEFKNITTKSENGFQQLKSNTSTKRTPWLSAY